MNCKSFLMRKQNNHKNMKHKFIYQLSMVSVSLLTAGVICQGTINSAAAENNVSMTISVDNADNPENIITSNGYGDQTFLNYLGLSAQRLANNNDLYASVMIAQALLESGWGTSGLAQAPNYNLFGVKGNYQGQSVDFSTQEDDGTGNLFSINSGFRRYPSYKESLEDYVRVLRSNEQLYGPVWKSNAKTYQDATRALTGHYATDTTYDQKLNSMIEKYDLTRFDQVPEVNSPVSANDIVVNKVNWVVNQAQTLVTSKNAYQKQQAPIIILNHYNHPIVQASPSQPQEETVMPTPAHDEIAEEINFNKEITQAAVKPSNSMVKSYSNIAPKQKVIPVKKATAVTSKAEPSVPVDKSNLPQSENEENSISELK
ncbi:glucosaminidase domain-containing protein [Bombilactobacillus bombi]|uniref:glucosaminidase domain-containing protein n=2 Tax=Bombilactobacillus bombi TaxID=1303590 RepID=UPI0035EFD7E0